LTKPKSHVPSTLHFSIELVHHRCDGTELLKAQLVCAKIEAIRKKSITKSYLFADILMKTEVLRLLPISFDQLHEHDIPDRLNNRTIPRLPLGEMISRLREHQDEDIFSRAQLHSWINEEKPGRRDLSTIPSLF
jgi:hypothetical protein